MKGRWKVAAGLLALVITGFALAGAAPAHAEDRSGDTTLQGAGVLTANGNGLAAMKGRLTTHIEADRGILLVKDIAGDATVDVRGVGGSGEWEGFTVYYGTGEADIAGSHVAVIILGEDIELRAAGRGWAYLKGRGTFFANGHGPFLWSPMGNFAAVDDGGAEPPPDSE